MKDIAIAVLVAVFAVCLMGCSGTFVCVETRAGFNCLSVPRSSAYRMAETGYHKRLIEEMRGD